MLGQQPKVPDADHRYDGGRMPGAVSPYQFRQTPMCPKQPTLRRADLLRLRTRSSVWVLGPGQKIDWMRLNPRVSVEVDEVKSHLQWKSAIITGRCKELPGTSEYSSERSQALTLLQKRYF